MRIVEEINRNQLNSIIDTIPETIGISSVTLITENPTRFWNRIRYNFRIENRKESMNGKLNSKYDEIISFGNKK